MSTRSLAKSGSKDDPRSSSARRLFQRMSALSLKAGLCGATRDVREVPIADIATYSITSSASNCIELGIVSLSVLAVPRLMTNSNLVGCSTGMSPGFSPLRIRAT